MTDSSGQSLQALLTEIATLRGPKEDPRRASLRSSARTARGSEGILVAMPLWSPCLLSGRTPSAAWRPPRWLVDVHWSFNHGQPMADPRTDRALRPVLFFRPRKDQRHQAMLLSNKRYYQCRAAFRQLWQAVAEFRRTPPHFTAFVPRHFCLIRKSRRRRALTTSRSLRARSGLRALPHAGEKRTLPSHRARHFNSEAVCPRARMPGKGNIHAMLTRMTYRSSNWQYLNRQMPTPTDVAFLSP